MSSLDKDGNEIKDGFRKRRKRREGWAKGAIRRGEIREPGQPRPVRPTDSNETAVEVPVATLDSKGGE